MKRILIVLSVLFLIIQFFRPAKNINTNASAAQNDIAKAMPMPDDVQTILKTSCYDCHSNNTVYPWYSNIQPVAWWLNHHIEEGKKELNFNEFAMYSPRRQFRKLEEINEQVKEGEMPLNSYTLIHGNAKLSTAQKLSIANWVEASINSMKEKYPIDSLLKKNKH